MSSIKTKNTIQRAALPMFLAAVFLAGLAGWVCGAVEWNRLPDRVVLGAHAWRALLIAFVFFTPLAGGMVIWPAIVMASHGRWAGLAEKPALAAIAWAPVSIIIFLLLWIGCRQWAPWMDQPAHQGAWLSEYWLFGRDLAALMTFWIVAGFWVRMRLAGRPTRLAGWVVFTYCITFSLIGFDLVMALDPHWYSALFGGYFFITGVYAAVAAWTLMVLVNVGRYVESRDNRPENCESRIASRELTTETTKQQDGNNDNIGASARQRHDLGKLIVAFSLLTTYLMFSQLIVIWYENLPDEVRFVIPRLRTTAWPVVSTCLLCTIYLGPLVLLLTTWSKRSPAYLGCVAALVLAGLWAERWWLVTPTLTGGRMVFGWPEVSITLSMAAMFVLLIRRRMRRMSDANLEDTRNG